MMSHTISAALLIVLHSCTNLVVLGQSQSCVSQIGEAQDSEVSQLLQITTRAEKKDQLWEMHTSGLQRFSFASPSVTSLTAQAKSLWEAQLSIPPSSTHVVINVGPNKNPVPDEEGAFRVLVEPLPSVVNSLRETTRGSNAIVLQSAISNFTGSAEFHEYNYDGVSSSLSSTAGFQKATTYTVAVHTLRELLDMIPAQTPISYLKTDMQGYDLTAIKSAGSAIKRIHRIHSEVYLDGWPSYAGVENELNRHWRPYMQQIGFRQDGNCTAGWVEEKKGYHELNCDFVPITSAD